MVPNSGWRTWAGSVRALCGLVHRDRVLVGRRAPEVGAANVRPTRPGETGRETLQIGIWARYVADLRRSAPRRPDETIRAQMKVARRRIGRQETRHPPSSTALHVRHVRDDAPAATRAGVGQVDTFPSLIPRISLLAASDRQKNLLIAVRAQRASPRG